MAPSAIAVVFALAALSQAVSVQHIRLDGTPNDEPLPQAEFSVSLSATVPRSAAKTALLAHLRGGRTTSAKTAVLQGSDQDEEYLTDITAGDQTFKVIVDTGSSDTWFPKVGFKCFNLTSFPEPQSECAFGTAGFDPSKSKTFTPFPDHNFNISYGDGEFVTGQVGFEDLTVGGMTVKQQEIGLVTNAAWNGDGVNTGLMGLAYPGLTSVFGGDNPDADSGANVDEYDPIFVTAIKEKVVSQPFFSVALDRGSIPAEQGATQDPHLGFLSFGGIAPVPVTSTSAQVPVQGFLTSNGSTGLFFYQLDVDSYLLQGKNVLKNTTAILDTGTTLNFVPDKVADALAAAFKPPANFSEDDGIFFVDCNAVAPDFEVKIGGAKFAVSGKDNILPIGADPDTGDQECILGTQPGGPVSADNIFILGDTFLHNVVATFNLGNNQITLTERQSY